MTWHIHSPLGRFGVSAPGAKRKRQLAEKEQERQELLADLRQKAFLEATQPRTTYVPLTGNSVLYQGLHIQPLPPSHSNVVQEYLRQHHMEWKDLTSEDAHQIVEIYARMIADGHEIS